MTLASFVGPIAAASGVCMALSPLLQARRVRMLGDSSEVSAGVFQVMRVNASIWLTYGILSANVVLIVPNVVGVVTTTGTLMVIGRYRHAGAHAHGELPAGEAPASAAPAGDAPAPAPLRRHAARVRGGALAVARAGGLVRR
jgi:uncharacterized protein with PQ loop repeat